MMTVPEDSLEGAAAPSTLSFGLADERGRIRRVLQTSGLMETALLFDQLVRQGYQCREGRRHDQQWLMRVFVEKRAS
jgi:hypothetical protein